MPPKSGSGSRISSPAPRLSTPSAASSAASEQHRQGTTASATTPTPTAKSTATIPTTSSGTVQPPAPVPSAHREWENATKSSLPDKHWLICWLEEVVPYQLFTEGTFNATAKSLICSVVVRCILLLGSLIPGGPFHAWGLNSEHGDEWNIWGPQEGPSHAVAAMAVSLYLCSVVVADYMPTFGDAAADKAAYTEFQTFWKMYVAEHRNPVDRVAHVFEFFGVFCFMALHGGRLTAFSMTLGLGALITRPLLHLAQPRIESNLMYVIGAAIATFYGVPVSFALGYSMWLAFDYTGHAYLGRNKDAAALLGRHYLGWALVGQTWFSTQVLLNFPAELDEAIKCWETQS